LPKEKIIMFYAKNVIKKLLILAITLVLVSCSSPAASMPKGPDAKWNVVVIGDSSMWYLGEALASKIEEDVGVKVELHPWIHNTLSAGEVLLALETYEEKGLSQLLKDAEFVVIWVNPMDSVIPEIPMDDGACFGYGGTVGSCPPEAYEKFTADLKAIYARIFELRDGQPTIVRGLDLYMPRVSQWIKQEKFEACTDCWENLSDATRLAAEAYNIPFLSRYDAFNGPNHNEDPREKGYIISDGIHPSVLAAEFTAELLSEMGYEPVTPP
jgi:hypothetical protein